MGLSKISKEYQPELNGMRAVAVILLLFFHLDFEVVSKHNLDFLSFDANHFTELGSMEFDEKMKTNYPFLFDVESLKKKYSVKK